MWTCVRRKRVIWAEAALPESCRKGLVLPRQAMIWPFGLDRCEQRGHSPELLAAEDFAFEGQPTTQVVGEDNPTLTEIFLEDLVLGAEVLDDFLLLAMVPVGPENLVGRQNRRQQGW